MKLNETVGKKIIISASGMADAGRIKHHLRHNLWRPESTVLFVGYQAVGTLGRRLLDGEKMVTIHGEQVTVKADIRHIDSYSAHADQAGLMTWLKHFTSLPRTVFLIHGEPVAMEALAQMIRDQLKVDVVVPNWMDEVDLGVSVVPQAVAQPAVTAPAPTTLPDQAMLAEQAYLEFRLKANQFFQKQWDAKRYEKLINKLNAALRMLDEA
jgi:metallo-beta-lactamase family protein